MTIEDTKAQPSGWAIASISDLIGPDGIFTDGDWVESKDQDPEGDVRLIQLADIGDGDYRNRSSRFLTRNKAEGLRCTFLRVGDVLVARMPDPLGRATIFPGDDKSSVTVVDVCIIRTGELSVDHRWLVASVNSPDCRAMIESLQSGTTRKRISRKNLATIQLPVPPLPEQKRIVAEIEKQFTRLDAAVASLKRAQANLKRHRASVLKAACEGKLVPTEVELARAENRDYEPADVLLKRILKERHTRWESDELAKMRAKGREAKDDSWKAKYKEPAPPETSELPDLPEGWVWTTVDQLLSLLRNGYSKKPTGEVGTPILRISAVRPLAVDISDIRFVDDDVDINGYLAEEGDILFTRYNGNPNLVGVCGRIPHLDSVLAHPDKLVRGVPIYGMPLSGWIEIAVNVGTSRAFLSRRVRTTAGQSGVSGEDIKSTPIPIPPTAEQRRIVAEVERLLSVIQASEQVVEANLRRGDRLRQSILKKAFEGKLVPQDPTDEPASVLLERIRAERAAAQPAKKPRRPGTSRGPQMRLKI